MSSSPSAALVAPSFEGDFSPGEAFSLEAGGVLQSPHAALCDLWRAQRGG